MEIRDIIYRYLGDNGYTVETLFLKRLFKDSNGEYNSADDIERDIEVTFGLSRDESIKVFNLWSVLHDVGIPTNNFSGSKAIKERWETMGLLGIDTDLTETEKWILSHKYDEAANFLLSFDTTNTTTLPDGNLINDNMLSVIFPIIRRALMDVKFKKDFNVRDVICFVNALWIKSYEQHMSKFNGMNHIDAEAEFIKQITNKLVKKWREELVNDFIGNE